MPFKNGCSCVCEICTCGRHTCPHESRQTRPKEGYGPCVISEYTQRYVPHEVHRIKLCKPSYKSFSNDCPMSDVTTHQRDYIKHQLNGHPRSQAKRDHEVYHPPESAMESTTMYKQDFAPKKAEVTRTVRQVQETEPGTFEGKPTYRTDYRQWELPGKRRSEKEIWNPPGDSFNGVTNYNIDFKAHNQKPPQSFKPTAAPIETDGPFDTMTEQRHAYVKHSIEPKVRRPRKVAWEKPKCPMDGVTTSMEAYPPKEASYRDSFKPVIKSILSDQPLSDVTTQKYDYKPWDLEKREKYKQPDEYVPPQGDMETHTTYEKDYPPHANTARPDKKNLIQDIDAVPPFDGISDYRTNFKRWNVPKPSLCKFRSQWSPPTDYLEDGTTHRTAYTPHPGFRPPPPCQPATNAMPSIDQPLEDRSTYRQDYVKKFSTCPAYLLSAPSSEYRFIDEDESTGHTFYQPLHVTVRNRNTNAVIQIPLKTNKHGKYAFQIPGSNAVSLLLSENK